MPGQIKGKFKVNWVLVVTIIVSFIVLLVVILGVRQINKEEVNQSAEIGGITIPKVSKSLKNFSNRLIPSSREFGLEQQMVRNNKLDLYETVDGVNQFNIVERSSELYNVKFEQCNAVFEGNGCYMPNGLDLDLPTFVNYVNELIENNVESPQLYKYKQ